MVTTTGAGMCARACLARSASQSIGVKHPGHAGVGTGTHTLQVKLVLAAHAHPLGSPCLDAIGAPARQRGMRSNACGHGAAPRSRAPAPRSGMPPGCEATPAARPHLLVNRSATRRRAQRQKLCRAPEARPSRRSRRRRRTRNRALNMRSALSLGEHEQSEALPERAAAHGTRVEGQKGQEHAGASQPIRARKPAATRTLLAHTLMARQYSRARHTSPRHASPALTARSNSAAHAARTPTWPMRGGDLLVRCVCFRGRFRELISSSFETLLPVSKI